MTISTPSAILSSGGRPKGHGQAWVMVPCHDGNDRQSPHALAARNHGTGTLVMTMNEVLLGAVMMLLKRHGEHASAKVAQRIGELAMEGDELGVAAWKAITRHMAEIAREKRILRIDLTY